MASAGDLLSRKLWFLDGAELCAAARRRTGLEDFGGPPLEPALAVLTDSLEREADLHPLGRFLMRIHLRNLLETRLRLAEAWRGRGATMDVLPLRRPLFITGMPRSGSTFLHELLAQDPDKRAPRVWEVMFPVARAETGNGMLDPRARQAEVCLWWFRQLAPGADAVFPMRAGTPHECVAIHSYTFLSQEFVSTCRVPTYESFLRASDLGPAYEWQRRFLQHLQFDASPRQWVLKSPDHFYGLAELFAVFPDALIIQTHRHPLEVLESSCRLTEVLHGLYARPAKHAAVAAHEASVLADAMDRLIRFRDAHPQLAGRFVDVTYNELVSEPLSVVRRIYATFDMPLGGTALERMRSLAAARSRYGRRRSAAPHPGLEGLPETAGFERYCARFQIA